MKISCIVPVYNTSKYLRQCLDSILNQSHQDLEVIIVNDCSTDNSAAICHEYEVKYPNKVIFINKQKNEGVDKARIDAINYVLTHTSENADSGLMFVDSDDTIESNTLLELSKCMVSENANIVEMRFNRCIGKIKLKGQSFVAAQIIEQPKLFEDYYISFFGINILSVSLWGKLYRTDILRKAKLTPSGFKMGEDLLMNLKIFPLLNKYAIIDYYGYNYRVGGLTSKFNPTLWSDLKDQYFLKRQCLFENNYEKALRPLNIELKNVFLSSIAQRLELLNESEDQLQQWVMNELCDDILWQDIKEMSVSESDPIYKHIATKNSEAIIGEVKNRLYAQRWRRRAKKVLMRIERLLHPLK